MKITDRIETQLRCHFLRIPDKAGLYNKVPAIYTGDLVERRA
jgi:hypothetical protein